MAERGRGHGCLRAGCFGCGGLFVLVLLVIGGMSAVGYANRPGPVSMQEDSRTLVEAPTLAGTTEGEGTGDSALIPIEARKPGLLRLDFDAGQFRLQPAPAGSALRVEGAYDEATHALTADTETLPNGTWSTTVRFRPRGGLLGLLFGGERPEPRLTIHVPRDLPLTLRADVSKAESRLELGGLTLEAVALDLSMGAHSVTFSEPTLTALSSFQLDGRMGETQVKGLGNASPARAGFEHVMGALHVDLDGAWRNGSDIRLRFRLGEAAIAAADDVPVQIVKAHVDGGEVVRVPGFGTTDAEASSRIRLDVAGSMGGLRLGR